jgi:oligoendopeptidase F
LLPKEHVVVDTVEEKQLTRDQIAIEDTWDLSSIFTSIDAWEEELTGIDAQVAKVVSYRGRLGEGPTVVKEAFDALYAAELSVYRTIVFASLARDEDVTNNDANVRFERAYAVAIRSGEQISFLEPELLALPVETLSGYAKSDVLATYHHGLEDLERKRAHVRSAEVEEVLAQFAEVSRAPSAVFDALDNSDLHFGTVTDDEGKTIELTQGRYAVLVESKNREVRKNAWETLIKPYAEHGLTISTLYGSSVRKDVVSARVRGYETVLEQALFDDNVAPAVYETLVDRVGNATDLVAKYLELRKRILGLDELHRYDLIVPLSSEPPARFEYREATEVVLDGVSRLGETYASDLRTGFGSRWVDIQESKGKRSGAYSSGVWGSSPYILMNWNGTLSDVFTLAHEAGHSMHSFYAGRAQPFHLAGYPIFLAEIASTVNEVLLNWHLRTLPENQAPDRQFALLNRFADGFIGTVVSQTQYAEFEQRAHQQAETGVPLTLEVLNGIWSDCLAKYQPGVVIDETTEVGWARIPHFYRAYYVYQYATGLTAAISLARAIRDEGEAARTRYLDMLAAGGSDYPLNLLKAAGVDLTSPVPFESALAEFGDTVYQMVALADGGLFD